MWLPFSCRMLGKSGVYLYPRGLRSGSSFQNSEETTEGAFSSEEMPAPGRLTEGDTLQSDDYPSVKKRLREVPLPFQSLPSSLCHLLNSSPLIRSIQVEFVLLGFITWYCVCWEESGRGSAHSGAGCSDSDHRRFCAGCPSPSKSSIPSPKQQAVCLHSATFGMHEHGCRERGGGFLKKVQGLRKRHLTRLPSSRNPLP